MLWDLLITFVSHFHQKQVWFVQKLLVGSEALLIVQRFLKTRRWWKKPRLFGLPRGLIRTWIWTQSEDFIVDVDSGLRFHRNSKRMTCSLSLIGLGFSWVSIGSCNEKLEDVLTEQCARSWLQSRLWNLLWTVSLKLLTVQASCLAPALQSYLPYFHLHLPDNDCLLS